MRTSEEDSGGWSGRPDSALIPPAGVAPSEEPGAGAPNLEERSEQPDHCDDADHSAVQSRVAPVASGCNECQRSTPRH